MPSSRVNWFKRFRSRAAAAALAVSLAAPGGFPAAQERSAPVVETAEVRLGLIEVTVVDRKGRHVRGLTADDFKLFERRDEVPIVSFDEIDLPPPDSAERPPIEPAGTEVAPEEEAAGGAPSAPIPSAGEVAKVRQEGPRYFVLFFDGYNNPSLLRFSQVRQAAKRWVRENLRPGDLVAVYEMTPYLYSITGFTQDSYEIAKAIDTARVFPGENMGSQLIEQRLTQGVRPDRSVLEEQLRNVGEFGADLLAAERDQFYQNVRSIAEIMQGFDGTKSVVLFSGGFPVTRSRKASAKGGFTVRFKDMLEEMDRAGIRVFSFDVGEEGGFTDASEMTNARLMVDELGLGTEWLDTMQIGAQVDSINAHHEILAVVANETGGRFFPGKDYASNLEAALDDLDHYYLIGYEPTGRGERERRYVPIRVEVDGKGLVARTRKGRFTGYGRAAPGAAEPRDAGAVAEVENPAAVAAGEPALALDVRPAFYPGPAGTTLVALTAEARGATGGVAVGTTRILDMTLEVTARLGDAVIRTGTRDLRLEVAAERAQALAGGIRLRDAIALPSSTLELVVSLKLNGTDLAGSWSEYVTVPERTTAGFSLTDLAILDPGGASPLLYDVFRRGDPLLGADTPEPWPDPLGDPEGRPSIYVAGTVSPRLPLLAQVRVYAPPPVVPGEPPSLKLDWELLPDGGGDAVAPPVRYRKLAPAPDMASLDVVVDLDLGAVPPGAYTLRLSATNRLVGRTERRAAAFVIAP